MVTVKILDYDIPLPCVVLYFGNIAGDIVLREDRYC